MGLKYEDCFDTIIGEKVFLETTKSDSSRPYWTEPTAHVRMNLQLIAQTGGLAMPTIKDVALRAGVSATTVSRVLNNRGYLSEELKHKVHQAMEELNYRPNELARSLSRLKSNIIGLIIPHVSLPFLAN